MIYLEHKTWAPSWPSVVWLSFGGASLFLTCHSFCSSKQVATVLCTPCPGLAFESLMGTGCSRGECQKRGENFLGLLSSCSGVPGQLGGRRGSPTKLSPKACLPGDASLPPPPGEAWIGGGRRPSGCSCSLPGTRGASVKGSQSGGPSHHHPCNVASR